VTLGKGRTEWCTGRRHCVARAAVLYRPDAVVAPVTSAIAAGRLAAGASPAAAAPVA
jgi:hypothetical protein